MLRTQLSASGITIMHSDEEADVDIVSSALTVANTCPVTLFGEDTHLLIFLLWHFNPSPHHLVHLYSNSSKTAVNIRKVEAVTQWWADTFKFCNTYLLWLWYHIKLSFCRIMYSIKKFFEKPRIPKSVEDLFISIRERRHIASWREKATSSVKWQEGENSWWASFYINIMKKRQDRFNIPWKLKFVYLLEMLHCSMCFG